MPEFNCPFPRPWKPLTMGAKATRLGTAEASSSSKKSGHLSTCSGSFTLSGTTSGSDSTLAGTDSDTGTETSSTVSINVDAVSSTSWTSGTCLGTNTCRGVQAGGMLISATAASTASGTSTGVTSAT